MHAGGRDVILVVDLGSSSVRATVVDRNGVRLRSEVRPRGYEPEPGVPGGFRFDPTDTWATIVALLRDVVDGLAPRVAGVTVTSIREGFVLLDEAGAEVWGCVNIDGRAGSQAQQLADAGIAAELFAVGGDGVSVTAPAKLLWLQEHAPDRWQRSARMVMLGDWMLLRLGAAPGTDPSLGSSSGLFDLRTRTWSPALLALLDAAHLAVPVQETGEVAGTVSARAAAVTGLREGTPLLRGGADTQLAFADAADAADAAEGGPVVGVCLGTFWQAAALPTDPVIDPSGRLRTVCHATPDRWLIEGIGFLHGPSIAALREESAQLGLDPAALESAAAAVGPGARGVRWVGSAVQDVGDLRHPPVTVLGHDPSIPRREQLPLLYRAALEDAALLAAAHLDLVGSVVEGADDRPCHLVGGAARSSLLAGMLADIVDRPVLVADEVEASTGGLALLVARRCWPDADPDVFRASYRTVEPDPARSRIYAQLRPAADELRRRILMLADDGLVEHRFRGAHRPDADLEV